jgi:hypothetical protein
MRFCLKLKLPHENSDDLHVKLPQRRHENLTSVSSSNFLTDDTKTYIGFKPKLPYENSDVLLAPNFLRHENLDELQAQTSS